MRRTGAPYFQIRPSAITVHEVHRRRHWLSIKHAAMLEVFLLGIYWVSAMRKFLCQGFLFAAPVFLLVYNSTRNSLPVYVTFTFLRHSGSNCKLLYTEWCLCHPMVVKVTYLHTITCNGCVRVTLCEAACAACGAASVEPLHSYCGRCLMCSWIQATRDDGESTSYTDLWMHRAWRHGRCMVRAQQYL